MSTVEIIDADKKKVDQISLGEGVMTVAPRADILHAALRQHWSANHHGTHRTKTRAEVDRTGKKVYKQKGTGNARHGSRKSSPFVGGGRVFGPKPRDYTFQLNKKFKKRSVGEALKVCLQAKRVLVLDQIPIGAVKTKKAVEFFRGLKIVGGLLILDGPSVSIQKSVRNIPNFKTAAINQISVHDLLKYPWVLCDKQSFEILNKRYLAA